MKRYLFLIGLMLSVMTHAQVRWLEDIHNFGAFSETDGTVSCEMKFVNESDKAVIINQVHVTCGCTSPTFDKKAIAPGDTGSVHISYNPVGRPGRFEKRIYVDLNTEPSRYTLYIKGSVIGSASTIDEKYPVKAGPLRLRTASAPFGEVVKGKSKSYFLEVYNASADTLSPMWTDIPKFISVGTYEKPLFPGENRSYTFMLASDKVADYGLTMDSVRLLPYPSHPENSYTIPVMIMVKEDFSHLTPGEMRKAPVISASESVVNFGEIKEDDSHCSTTVTISNKGENQLLIRRIYTSDPGITAGITSSKIKKGGKAELRISVDPWETSGKVINGRVTVISNDPMEPVLNIRVSGVKL